MISRQLLGEQFANTKKKQENNNKKQTSHLHFSNFFILGSLLEIFSKSTKFLEPYSYIVTTMSIIFCTTLPSNIQSGLSMNLMEYQLIANDDCCDKLFHIEKSQ